MQYRTSNSLCRRCHKPLDFEEPVQLAPQLVTSQPVPNSGDAGSQVAAQVRDLRRARHLSQRQLAGRMQVPRTYISKIENGKAIPTLGSLERLALALGVEVRNLVRDARSRRDEEVAAILSDPFLAEIARCCRNWTRCTGRCFSARCVTPRRDAGARRRSVRIGPRKLSVPHPFPRLLRKWVGNHDALPSLPLAAATILCSVSALVLRSRLWLLGPGRT
jgi:transcriptional regulator with XRE-family HTH domain